MTMKTIIWILLALSLHLNAEDSEDQFTCRRSNCACYRVDPEKFWFDLTDLRCSHEVYRQNLIYYPDAKVNELLTFPFIELSYYSNSVNIHCLNFNRENISTANTPLFDLIPKLNTGISFMVHVIFKGCPFPDESFETLFNILSVTDVENLEFMYSPSNIIQSSLVNITRDLFSNLPNLKELDISGNNISALEPGVFQHLIHLENLSLNNNKITTLDQDIFKNLTSLVYLYINNNRLVTLTHDLFSNLHNLTILYISHNNISALEPGVFQHLIQLKVLDLRYNKITTLDQNIFKNLTSLVNLYIDNNQLVTLTHDLFSNLHNLRILHISHNNISALEPGVFQHLIHLEKLGLRDNIITTLDRDIFKNLTSLEYLWIDNNRLVNLTHDLFCNSPSLIYLNISNNNISVLPSAVFDKLSNLNKLDISNNNISVLPSAVFDKLSNLNILELSNNKITTLDQDIFKNLTSLKDLWINNNRLVTLTHNLFSHLPKVRYINISNNNISVLPQGVFDNLTLLFKIYANGNPFKEFPGSLFSKTNKLETINLQYQRSSRAIPENCLSNLSKLEEVDSPLKDVPSDLFRHASNVRTILLTGHKQLVSLPEKLFYDCEALSKLDLSDNGLETLHHNLFQYSQSLIDLNLSRNRLVSFDHQFPYFSRLMQLNLSHNEITRIYSSTILSWCSSSERLESIDLSNNFLKTIPDDLDELSYGIYKLNECHKLETIKLSNNNISYIYNWIFYIKGLKKLDLRWNNITSIPDYVLLSTVHRNMRMDLSYNQIEIVEFNSTPAVRNPNYDSNKRNIILNGNPIACNCSNYDLFRFIQGKMVPLQTDEFTVIKFETNNINTCKPSNMSINIVDPTQLTCDTVAGCPSSCKCNYSPYDHQIRVDCSSANLTNMPQNLNITLEDKRAIPWNSRKTNRTIQLILRNNSIQQLLQDTPEYYAWVTVLDLSFNNIKDSKHILQHLPRLETLNLSHNHLESLSQDFIKLLSSSNIISSLFLSGNKWKCDCNITDLYNFLSLNEKKIVKDSEEIICDDSSQLYKMKPEDFCPTPLKVITVLSIILALLGVLGPLVTCLYYKYQDEIKVWLYAHKILLCWVSEKNIDSKKIYDAFVSYAEEDYGFVVKTFIPELEKSFRICHHERDFVPGEFITEQIYEKVSQSRRTIIVLTEHFLRSRWCDLEFRTAHAQAMKDCSRVIILIYGDMPPQETMPEKMRTYMSMNTYIKWGDTWFWEKIKYALPHRPARFAESDTTQNASNSMPMQNIIGSNSTQVCSATSSSQTNT